MNEKNKCLVQHYLDGWKEGWMEGWMDGCSSPRPADNHQLYLLVVRGPDPAGDLALQVDLGGPVALPADGAHQHEAVPVRDQRLGAVVGPGEVTHLLVQQQPPG